jgi:type I restriction enzyme, S subunit
MMPWRKGTLKDLVDLQRGYDLPSQNRKPGNIPVMGGGGMNGYHAVSSNKGPGVVIGRSGAGFGSAFYSETDFWAHNTVLFVKDFKGNNPKYVFHFLKYIDFSKYNSGGAQPSLNRNFIYPIEIKIPPFPEQAEIANLLDCWDLAIQNTERLIAAKEKQKISLMQSLLTGIRRIKGFQNPWSEFHLGELFKERDERASDHLPLVSITREYGIIPRNEDRKDTSSEDKSNYLRICPGDIGYNTMRMWQGVSALSTLEGIVSPAYTICTPKKGVGGEFMAYLFKLPRTINLFYRHSQGLTSDTWNLKFKHFKQIKVTIPEIEEQKAIARILKICDEEISLLKIELTAFQKQKRGLMQKLLTGEWRVKVG